MAAIVTTPSIRAVPVVITRVYLDGAPFSGAVVTGRRDAIRYDARSEDGLVVLVGVLPIDRQVRPELNDVEVVSSPVGSVGFVVVWTGSDRPSQFASGPALWVPFESFVVATCGEGG